MNSSEDPRGKGIDADRVVSRLLDIIQEQQTELAKYRDFLGSIVPALKSAKPPEKQTEMVQVAELDGIEKDNSPEIEPTIEQSNVGRSFRENRIFLTAAAMTLLGTVIFAFKPQNPEVSRLSTQLRTYEDTVRKLADEKDRAATAHNEEIVDLQRKLKNTEEALSQNESALLKTQDALREVSQQAAGQPSVQATQEARTKKEQCADAMNEIARIRTDLGNARSALIAARKSYIDNEQTLARNRLALHTIGLAEEALDRPPTQPVPPRQWIDFVDPDALPLIRAKIEELPSYEIEGEPKSDDLEALKSFEQKEVALLTHCIADLRNFQARIIEKQREVSDIEVRIKGEEAKLLERQLAQKRAGPQEHAKAP